MDRRKRKNTVYVVEDVEEERFREASLLIRTFGFTLAFFLQLGFPILAAVLLSNDNVLKRPSRDINRLLQSLLYKASIFRHIKCPPLHRKETTVLSTPWYANWRRGTERSLWRHPPSRYVVVRNRRFTGGSYSTTCLSVRPSRRSGKSLEPEKAGSLCEKKEPQWKLQLLLRLN